MSRTTTVALAGRYDRAQRALAYTCGCRAVRTHDGVELELCEEHRQQVRLVDRMWERSGVLVRSEEA